MSETTCIRNAAWVAAWDQSGQRHVYAREIDVAFTDGAIVHVGPNYTGACDREIDGSRRFVMPGLVNIHAHPCTELATKGIREDHGVPEQYMTGLYERMLAFRLDTDGQRAGAEAAYAEALQCGITTLADLSGGIDGWLDLQARSGLRMYAAPAFASARWRMEQRHELLFDWDEKAGEAGFERAIALMEQAEAHECGRIKGIVFPAQIETVTPDLFRKAKAYADQTGRPITTHISQSVIEFNEIVQRHGVSPVQYGQSIGLLGPSTILGHCMFIDQHSSLRWHTRDDLRLLAESGTSVAHCPAPFARYGDKLEDIGAYAAAGVNVGMGTDVAPHNLLEEMRLAIILARVHRKHMDAANSTLLFNAATLAGAKALGRDDIGRLAPGAKADIVLVDLDNEDMRPLRDPIRTLIFTAVDRAIAEVFVDGRQVVENGKCTTLDRTDALQRLEAAQQRMISNVPQHDFMHRTAEEISPLTLPTA
ncbi:MAG: amidohydrolase family protein [Alphaproteobacteria bacterium]